VSLLDPHSFELVRAFFNDKREIILCSASKDGEPNAALMGSCRLSDDGHVDFEIIESKDSSSVTFTNLAANGNVLFMRFIPGERARHYKGLRIYAKVEALHTSGPKLDEVRGRIRAKWGDNAASETKATVSCQITAIRPIVDMGQEWKNSL
jgi:hypothetical protein